MKVKIGESVISPEEFPIAIFLTEDDKKLIQNMDKEATVVAFFPEGAFKSNTEKNKWVHEFKIKNS